VIETYRMFGREHELDLEREARGRALARVARPRRSSRVRLNLIARRLYVARSHWLRPATPARGGAKA
jgi:hypothetical protein